MSFCLRNQAACGLVTVIASYYGQALVDKHQVAVNDASVTAPLAPTHESAIPAPALAAAIHTAASTTSTSLKPTTSSGFDHLMSFSPALTTTSLLVYALLVVLLTTATHLWRRLQRRPAGARPRTVSVLHALMQQIFAMVALQFLNAAVSFLTEVGLSALVDRILSFPVVAGTVLCMCLAVDLWQDVRADLEAEAEDRARYSSEGIVLQVEGEADLKMRLDTLETFMAEKKLAESNLTTTKRELASTKDGKVDIQSQRDQAMRDKESALAELTTARQEKSVVERTLDLVKKGRRTAEENLTSLNAQLAEQLRRIKALEDNTRPQAVFDTSIVPVHDRIQQLDLNLQVEATAIAALDRRTTALENLRDTTNSTLVDVHRTVGDLSRLTQEQGDQVTEALGSCTAIRDKLSKLTQHVEKVEEAVEEDRKRVVGLMWDHIEAREIQQLALGIAVDAQNRHLHGLKEEMRDAFSDVRREMQQQLSTDVLSAGAASPDIRRRRMYLADFDVPEDFAQTVSCDTRLLTKREVKIQLPPSMASLCKSPTEDAPCETSSGDDQQRVGGDKTDDFVGRDGINANPGVSAHGTDQCGDGRDGQIGQSVVKYEDVSLVEGGIRDGDDEMGGTGLVPATGRSAASEQQEDDGHRDGRGSDEASSATGASPVETCTAHGDASGDPAVVTAPERSPAASAAPVPEPDGPALTSCPRCRQVFGDAALRRRHPCDKIRKWMGPVRCAHCREVAESEGLDAQWEEIKTHLMTQHCFSHSPRPTAVAQSRQATRSTAPPAINVPRLPVDVPVPVVPGGMLRPTVQPTLPPHPTVPGYQPGLAPPPPLPTNRPPPPTAFAPNPQMPPYGFLGPPPPTALPPRPIPLAENRSPSDVRPFGSAGKLGTGSSRWAL